jgi:hypothetical protein
MPHREGDHIVETPTEARAAVTGHNARYVLAIAVVAVIAAFVGVYLYFFV